MAGYTRQSEAGIVDGGIISANDLNAEFDQIETAMGALGHSHSGAAGEGPQITTAGIADSAVTTVKVNDSAVTTAKIADANVTNAKLATDAVSTAKIEAGAVTTAKIADANVTTAKIEDGAVTNAKIGTDAVTLGTQTTGNYVATVAGTSPVVVSGSGTETAAVTVSVNDATTTTKGIAQFNSTDFAVTGGVVTLNKDPVITLTGAVIGSGTMTDLGSVSIATSSSPTLTLAGDVSGSATFTNLASATLTVTVADDSHDHVISNVDGLQTALDAKQNAATALTTTTSFGGDVSGTYNAIVVADDSHNHIISNVDGLQAALDLKAPLDSPVLSGVPTAPTAAASNNTTQIATTSFVKTQISLLVDSAPATLDTLNELAAALGDDPNFATTVSTAIGLKAPIESPTFTGTPSADTATTGTNTTQLATTAFVQQEISAIGAGITEVAAGAGLTGGGTSGVVTLNVGAGTGITVNADTIAITDNAIGATQLNVTGNGTAGQALTSDGDGSFSWTTIASPAPAGTVNGTNSGTANNPVTTSITVPTNVYWTAVWTLRIDNVVKLVATTFGNGSTTASYTWSSGGNSDETAFVTGYVTYFT